MKVIRDYLGRPAPDKLQPFLNILDCTDVMELAGMYGEAREIGDTDLMSAIDRRIGQLLALVAERSDGRV